MNFETELGNILALVGAIIAVVLTCSAASIGTRWVQEAVAGVISEQPDKFGKTLVLQLIPSSAALYGFVVGFLILLNTILAPEGAVPYTTAEGLTLLVTCFAIGIVGFVATLMQAKVCTAGVKMIGRDGTLSGRALTMAVFIELFTLFSLIVSILAVL
ncbi:MAG: permease [Firmicutes bacterium]|nr:permease [Bacillota bacterium]